jgi:flagellin-like protein
MPTSDPGTVDRRAQSEVVAVVLLIGLTVAGTGAVVVFGADAVRETTQSTDIGRAEHAMTQLDSKTSLVAHGSSEVQRVDVVGDGQGSVSVGEESGWMRVRIINESTGNVESQVMNETMGAVVYERGGTSLAYQGGGVWRRDASGSTLVSPPAFHYRGQTLTLPLILIGGEASSTSAITMSQQAPPEGMYPNETAGRRNPLLSGRVNVTVRSDYYQAWGRFFEDRTQGDVAYDHANGTVTVQLVTPFSENFDNVIAATDPGGINPNPGPPPSPSETGIYYPSVDSKIESKVTDCETTSNCTSGTSTITTDGTYYYPSGISSGMSIDTSDGDVELVVNGSFSPGTVTVAGDNNVTVFTRQNFVVGDDINAGGDAAAFRALVHSDGVVDMNGNYKFVGIVYAPESSVDLNGGGPPWQTNVEGAIISETIDVNGNPNKFQYDPAVENATLDLGTTAPKITYLHVSVTRVNATAT